MSSFTQHRNDDWGKTNLPTPPHNAARDPLFEQLDKWKAKGYVVSFMSASGDMNVQGAGVQAGWAIRLETPGSFAHDDRGGNSPHLRVTSAVCATPESAILAMLTMVQP